MAKKPAEPILLDELLQEQEAERLPEWLRKIKPEHLAQLEVIKKAHKEGNLTIPLERIRAKAAERFGLRVSKTTFRDWMRT